MIEAFQDTSMRLAKRAATNVTPDFDEVPVKLPVACVLCMCVYSQKLENWSLLKLLRKFALDI